MAFATFMLLHIMCNGIAGLAFSAAGSECPEEVAEDSITLLQRPIAMEAELAAIDLSSAETATVPKDASERSAAMEAGLAAIYSNSAESTTVPIDSLDEHFGDASGTVDAEDDAEDAYEDSVDAEGDAARVALVGKTVSAISSLPLKDRVAVSNECKGIGGSSSAAWSNPDVKKAADAFMKNKGENDPLWISFRLADIWFSRGGIEDGRSAAPFAERLLEIYPKTAWLVITSSTSLAYADYGYTGCWALYTPPGYAGRMMALGENKA